MRPDPIKTTLLKLKPFIGKKADALWMRHQSSDWKERQDWEQTISTLAQKYSVDTVEEAITLPPPSHDLSQGEITLGTARYIDTPGHEFSITLPELTRHMGIFGSTGSGKTTLAKNILRQLLKRRIPFILFDWERNYRDLLPEAPDLKIFTVGSTVAPFRFNYLNLPPGLTFPEYVKSVVDVFNRAYVGGVGSDTVLLKAFDLAYKLKPNPTSRDIQEILKEEMKGKLRGREMLWKQSSMRMLDFLCYGGTGEVFGTQAGYPIESLFNDSIVFELGALASPYDKRFFVEVFTLWYFLYKEHMGIEHKSLKHVVVFEEFHNIIENTTKNDFIQKIFRQMRKYGTGLIILDQTPSLIPNPIFENMYTKISFSLNHRKNIQAIADSMFMEIDERKYIGMLETGQAVCRLMGRYQRPFLLDVPFIQPGPNASDDDLKKHMSRFSQFSTPIPAQSSNQRSVQGFQKTETLSPLARILLEDIAKFPLLGISARYKNLGLGAAEGTAIQRELVEKNMVVPVSVDGKKFMGLTEVGKGLVRKWGVKNQSDTGRGGLEHGYFVDRIKNHLVDQGNFAFVEQNDIDIVAFKLDARGERKIAIQVETGKSNMKKNIETLLNYDANEKIITPTNKEAEIKLAEILRQIPAPNISSIKMLSAKEFLSLSLT